MTNSIVRNVATLVFLGASLAAMIWFGAVGHVAAMWPITAFAAVGMLLLHADRIAEFSVTRDGVEAKLREAKDLAKEAAVVFEDTKRTTRVVKEIAARAVAHSSVGQVGSTVEQDLREEYRRIIEDAGLAPRTVQDLLKPLDLDRDR